MALCVVAVAPTPASAATALGAAAFADGGSCAGNTTYLQSISPGALYTAPSDGVITSWSYHPAGSPPTQIKLKVAHPSPGADLTAVAADFTIVGESGLETPVANTLNTWSTRVSTHVGDEIGIYLSNDGDCLRTDSNYFNHFNNQDVLPGTTQTFFGEEDEISVSAVLEADADHDGFGDETQDQCPTNGTTQGPCPVKQKKCKKHKKHRSAESAKKKKCKKKKHH